ncbi:hypothetical protein V1293_006950 [Bradyrhizobium sp. AZCC 1693]
MFFVAAVLAILSGLFYAAARHEIGSLGVTMCQYGSPFCDSPFLVLVAFSCWSLPGWLRAGAHSSACADAVVRSPRISVMMPLCR